MPVPRERREALLDLLEEFAAAAGDRHTAAIESLRGGSPSRADLELLRELAADQLMMRGFRDDWEPNEFGLAMEDLINMTTPMNWGFD